MSHKKLLECIRVTGLSLALSFPVVTLFSASAAPLTAPIKVGIIGLDAHVVPWTEILHGPKAAPPLSDLRVVAASLVEAIEIFREAKKSGTPPMTPEHTLEIYAFMEAADESLRQGGGPVSLPNVLEKAHQKADAERNR